VASSERTRDNERAGFMKRAARGASERVFDIVDPDVVLDYVDVNALLDRVDVNALLDRVDVNTLLDRVDVDALLERADVDALMERVDVQAIVERAGIPEIVAESTGHLGGSALDLARRPLVGLDEIILRVLNGIVRRDISEYPEGPGELVAWADERVEEKEAIKTGRYAGPLTRLLAVIVDSFIVAAGFTLITAGAAFLIGLFVVGDVEFSGNRGVWFGVALATWAFVYMWVSLAVFGKTVGKMVLGVRVVGAEGTIALHGRQAFIRTLTYPFSFALFGIGLLGVIFGRERRAWHDHLAGTAVVYDWGSRTAQMPTPLAEFLERRGSTLSVTAADEEE
jgi:uncharacterized RDD family membrane protein YckC